MFADCRMKKKCAIKIGLHVDKILSKTSMTTKEQKVPCRSWKSKAAQERGVRARRTQWKLYNQEILIASDFKALVTGKGFQLQCTNTRVTPSQPKLNWSGGELNQSLHIQTEIKGKCAVIPIKKVSHFTKLKPKNKLPKSTGSVLEMSLGVKMHCWK